MIRRCIQRIMTLLQTLHERLSIKRDYQAVFSTPEGQRVLRDLLRRGGVTRPDFTTDPQKMLINEGHRHMVLSIYRQVHASDEPLLKMISEETQRQNEQHHA